MMDELTKLQIEAAYREGWWEAARHDASKTVMDAAEMDHDWLHSKAHTALAPAKGEEGEE